MPPTSSVEPTGSRDVKETADFIFGPFDHDIGSFFDMSYDADQTASVGSSDASFDSSFFEETQLASASLHGSASSPISSFIGQGFQSQGPKHPAKDYQQESADSWHHNQLTPSSLIEAFAPGTQPIRKFAPISQKLVHRFRPEGVSISQEDLLSLEGRRSESARTSAQCQPKTPPLTPGRNYGSERSTPKTPRTPKESSARINKAQDFLKTPTRHQMQSSNYWVGREDAALRDEISHRMPQLKIGSAGICQHDLMQDPNMPLSPSLPDHVKPQRSLDNLAIWYRQHNYTSALPTPLPTRTARQYPSLSMAAARNMADSNYSAHVYETDPIVSPLTPWEEGQNENLAFSPVSPLLDEAVGWGGSMMAPVAHMQHSTSFQSDYESDSPTLPHLDFFDGYEYHGPEQGGLMIDFGNEELQDSLLPAHYLQDSEGQSFMDSLTVLQPESSNEHASHGKQCKCSLTSCPNSKKKAKGKSQTSKSPQTKGRGQNKSTTKPGMNFIEDVHCEAQRDSPPEGLRIASTSRALKPAQPLHPTQPLPTAKAAGKVFSQPKPNSRKPRQGSGNSGSHSSSNGSNVSNASNVSISTTSTTTTSGSGSGSGSGGGSNRTGSTSSNRTGGKSANASAQSDMFVNFTPNDSRRILTGVAPSGSSKTKARREKEALERRRKLSEAAKRAVREAGGDWERVVGELVEV